MIVIPIALATAHAAERVAVVVGSNAPSPGAVRLRYADDDARDLAATLVDVAHFDPAAVHVLLEPDPKAVVAALERAVREAEGVVLFYYSGHADPYAIYPGGAPLPLDQVRQILLASDVKLRVGIIDACSGGSWTGAKGMTVDAVPFALPDVTDSEGAAWIASTSGSEAAHEAEIVGGSLFTHHLVVGLRGAADGTGEGAVSLWEAFDYAKRNTTRDAALYAGTPQTPSFDMQVRGRRDLVLSEVDGASSELQLSQDDGPLQVVQVDTGVILLELEHGRRAVRLGLPPGTYVVRSPQAGGTVRSIEVLLRAGEVVVVAETDLELHGVPSLEAKGASAVDLNALTLPPRHVDLRLRVPVGFFRLALQGVGADASVGVSDRVEITTPGLIAYRGGDREATDWVAYGGWTGVSRPYDSLAGRYYWRFSVGIGADVLRQVGRRSQFQAGVFVDRTFRAPPAFVGSEQGLVQLGAQALWTYTVAERVTFNLGMHVAGAVAEEDGALKTGSVLGLRLTRAGQRIPLVQWRATPEIAIDLYPSDQWTTNLDWDAPLTLVTRGTAALPLLLGTTITL